MEQIITYIILLSIGAKYCSFDILQALWVIRVRVGAHTFQCNENSQPSPLPPSPPSTRLKSGGKIRFVGTSGPQKRYHRPPNTSHSSCRQQSDRYSQCLSLPLSHSFSPPLSPSLFSVYLLFKVLRMDYPR